MESNGETFYSKLNTVTEIFYQMVKKYPANIAIKYKNVSLTYELLNSKSNQLAHILKNQGVKSGLIVGLMIDRCPEAIIAQLAIVKAGGAYLYINPSFPAKRISYMLQEANIQLLITDCKLDNMSYTGSVIDPFDLKYYSHCSKDLKNTSLPNDIVYVIYTSGSTGRPKGVLIPHRGIPNHVFHFTNELKITHKDNIAQFANYSFDASVSEIMMALLNGASLHIVQNEIINDFRKFEEFLNNNKISIITLPPPYLVNLRPKNIKYLRGLIAAGSPSSHAMVKAWQEKVLYVNAYGPSETTICATTYICNKDTLKYQNIPIGKPISNFHLYILQENKHLLSYIKAECGTTGELCIGGIGLAKGYLNAPELTAKRFIFHPDYQNMRLYRSGDIVKKNADGLLEFIGREDDQVKIRGYRVELGEIREALLKMPEIKDCFIMSKINEKSDNCLHAYIISSQKVSIDQVRQFLAKNLPFYMVPEYIIFIKSFPLNANGKINKEQLQLPNLTLYSQNNNNVKFKEELGEVESIFINICKNTLNVDSLNLNKNFFDLGGNSLKAIQLVSDIREFLKIELSIRDIFESPNMKAIMTSLKGKSLLQRASIGMSTKNDKITLSSEQKRLYFLWKMYPKSIAYNEQLLIKVKAEINKLTYKLLLKNIKRLIYRHEILRTSFKIIDNVPYQIINKKVTLKIEKQKLDSSPDDTSINNLLEFITPFDLSKPPLYRIKLLLLSNNEFLFFMDIHHIIIDGLSINILLREFAELCRGTKLDLIDYSYKDYNLSQSEFAKSKEYYEAEKYWFNTHQNKETALNLPTDFNRFAKQCFEGDTVSTIIDKNLTNNLKQISRNNSISLYMLLLASFYLVLYKYTNQKDITIGCPASNRIYKHFYKVVGMFVNTLPIRCIMNKDNTIAEFLKYLKENVTMALLHQNYQFDDLVKKLNIKRDSSRSTLFDVIFVMQPEETRKFTIDGLILEKQTFLKKSSIVDLLLEVNDRDEVLILNLQFTTALFNKNTAVKMLKHYSNILEKIQSSDLNIQKISTLDILSNEERNKILFNWNNTDLTFESARHTLHELFELKAAKKKNQVAVIFDDKSITYDELNRKANQLANYLIKYGSKTNKIIAILMERSIDLIISILGIWKIGSAYLPLDPSSPKERLATILADADTDIILAHEKYIDLISQTNKTKIICIESALDQIKHEPTTNLANNVAPKALAYVIYTSGSTGKPKGVLVEHRHVLNTLLSLEKNYPLGANDRYLLKTNYCFDVSLTELCGWFIGQGTLSILKQGKEKEPSAVINSIIKSNITHINFVPSMLAMTIKDLSNINVSTKLKYIFVAGEEFPIELAFKVYAVFGKNIRIINIYGPTEVSIYATYYEIDLKSKRMFIGKPLPNVKAYVLDPDLLPVPIGSIGELYIGGKGVSRGYLNKTDLTRNKFIANPYIRKDIIYKTGDLARYTDDGNIEFLGRSDFQIKLRGIRIEIGEIESVLRNINEVKDVLVLVEKDTSNFDQLVAYIILNQIEIKSDKEPEITIKLKSILASKLPSYMIPQSWVYLKDFPINSNGKVDRNALPKPKNEYSISKNHTEPRNEIEWRIAKIWEKVLNLTDISIYDDFFDIGGHSLKVIELYSIMLQEFNIDINDIYDCKTIAALASKITYCAENIKERIHTLSTYLTKMDALPSTSILLKINSYKENAFSKYQCINIYNKKIYKNILLTGSTGYLGMHLLRDLLEQTNINIYLIIRGNNADTAKKRLILKSLFYFNTDLTIYYKDRINIICGDLSKNKFNLSMDVYNKLSLKIDCILNLSALVKHYGHSKLFFDNNVKSVEEIIKFSLIGSKKSLHHISTTSVGYDLISDSENRVILYEDKPFVLDKEINNYYTYTKALSEKLIQDARRESGLIANVYRVGNMVLSYKTNSFQENVSDNAFCRILKSIYELGIIPDDNQVKFDFTYVDQVSQAIALLFDKKELENNDFNLTNTNTLSLTELWQHFCSLKQELKVLSRHAYFESLLAKYNKVENKPYVISLLMHLYNPDMYKKNIIILKDKTDLILNNIGFRWNKIDSDKVKAMLTHSLKIQIL